MRRHTFTMPVVLAVGSILVAAPAAMATTWGEPAPGGRTCFSATDRGDGTTLVTTGPDLNDPNLDDNDFFDWLDNNAVATNLKAGASTVVVGITPKKLTATATIAQNCGGIDNVVAVGLENDNDFIDADVVPADYDNPRASGVSQPSSGTDTNGTWTLPYNVPAGVSGTYYLTGFFGWMNWTTAILNADGSVASSTATDDAFWISGNYDEMPALKILRQTRGTVSGPPSAKARTSFTLKVQTQKAGEGRWVSHPYAVVKMDYNTGSGWKYLKTVKITSRGIYNTKVQLTKTTQYRYRNYATGGTASYVSKTTTVKRR